MAEKTPEEMREAGLAIREKMAAAAREAGRDPAEVQLCAACKTRTAETVAASAALPIDVFGENHVQELCANFDAGAYCGKPSHFIGHLQTNKVKAIVPYVSMIETIDSLRLLKEVNKQAEKIGRTIDVLLELHIAKEETKSGMTPEEWRELLAEGEWKDFHNVRICGIMMMASNVDDQEQIRSEFLEAAAFFDEIKAEYFADDPYFTERSYGMSGDYLIAQQCRSTMVRIGTSIFGPRVY